MSEGLHFLITSVGRRTSLVQFFEKELEPYGQLITSDMTVYAAAMHTGTKKLLLPGYRNDEYLDNLLKVCKKNRVQALTSLTDYELTFLSGFKKTLLEHGIAFIGPDVDVSQKCLDKWLLYKELESMGFASVKTFIDIDEFESALYKKCIEFPVFIKPRFGSGSVHTFVAENLEEVHFYFYKYKNMIIQEFICGDEFGVDVYRDFISSEIVSIFVKKKLYMRAGETDKAVSVQNPQIIKLVEDFVRRFGLTGVSDLDILYSNGQYYILEANPRFGGGYPLAYECGCNFPRYIINNLLGEKNRPEIGNYPTGVCMFKCDHAIFASLDDHTE